MYRREYNNHDLNEKLSKVCFSQDGRFWPGLGGSDSDYAWVLASYPLFQVVVAVVIGALFHRLPFNVNTISLMILYVTGGVMYALAESVWTVFVGFGLLGAGSCLNTITVLTYLGEMGDQMDEMRVKQGKNPLKFLLYFGYSVIITGGFIIPFGKHCFPASLVLIVSVPSLQQSTQSWLSLILLHTTGLAGSWLS